jgi:hypothetical protein
MEDVDSSNKFPINIYKNEVKVYKKIQEKASNISPKLIDAWICDNTNPLWRFFGYKLGYILMENWTTIPLSGSLVNISNKIKHLKWENFIDLFKKYSLLHFRCRVIHADIRTPNVLWKKEKDKIEFALIDFGLSKDYEKDIKLNSYYEKEFYKMVLLDYIQMLEMIYNVIEDKSKIISKFDINEFECDRKRIFWEVILKILDTRLIQTLMYYLDIDLQDNKFYKYDRDAIKRNITEGDELIFMRVSPTFHKKDI